MSRNNDDEWAIPVLIVVGFVFVFGLGFGLVKHFEDPPPCSDYSYIMSRIPFNQKVAACDKWIDMEMTLDRSIVHGTTVNCKCP
jgi:hypothetical protein